jgi:transposase-like protein
MSYTEPEPIRRLEVVTRTGRRRNWPAEQKARIVAESYASGETVCAGCAAARVGNIERREVWR